MKISTVFPSRRTTPTERNWFQKFLLAVAVFTVLCWIAMSAGVPPSAATTLSALWVVLVWSVRRLVRRWEPGLGRATAWAATILLFAVVGGMVAVSPPVCQGICRPADVGTVIILSATLPLLVLVYTGPFMWVVTRTRRWWRTRTVQDDASSATVPDSQSQR